MQRSVVGLALILGALLLTHCAGGGGSSGSSSPAPTQTASGDLEFLVKDSPVDGLASFTATIASLTLTDTAGTETANLLAESVEVEFLGLQERSAWLGRVDVPAAEYASVSVVFDTNSIEAMGEDGTPLVVNVLADRFECDLPSSDLAGSHRLLLDLDLASSLGGTVGGGVLEFTPTGALTLNPAGPLPLLPIVGRYVGDDDAGDLQLRVLRWNILKGGAGA